MTTIISLMKKKNPQIVVYNQIGRLKLQSFKIYGEEQGINFIATRKSKIKYRKKIKKKR